MGTFSARHCRLQVCSFALHFGTERSKYYKDTIEPFKQYIYMKMCLQCIIVITVKDDVTTLIADLVRTSLNQIPSSNPCRFQCFLVKFMENKF